MERYIPGPAGSCYFVESGSSHQTANTNLLPPVGGDILSKNAWKQMEKDLFESSGSSERQGYGTASLRDVEDGTYDLKVPRLIVQVVALEPSTCADWRVELQDQTGAAEAFISTSHMGVVQERRQGLAVGCVLLLENVSVFVSAAPVIRRHLCLHPQCLVAVWR